jgi:hypothetical protein
MPADLPLRCQCGRIRGVAGNVSPSSGFRFICYCRDCQAFARWLGRTDGLDSAGGTGIFHMPPARVKLTAGLDALQCLCFSSKVLRWYGACCRTPIANTAASPGFPVLGLINCFMDPQAGARSLDKALGPPLCRLYQASATGPLPSDAPGPLSPGIFFRRVPKLLGWWARGLNRPTPFFDEQTKAPRAEPRVLGPGERAGL